ncbi:hypothetical protein [Solidesulfovibrio carbinolicus]|uniref:hypothetical protein n=1 Tax=Solidesulfovibrio carbinolicus TaxID=296842 RepID=UPI0010128709|nr:hypothetical protein [Solidesulfovibrio carbinolicus]
MLQGSDFVSYIWMYAALLHTIIGLHAQIAISIFSFIAMLLFWRVSLLRWIFLTILILVAGPRLFVSGGKIVSDALTTTVIKYKIIVEVETPEGLKTGSNVVQVTITPKFVHWNPSSPPVSTRVKAEAIFIDLGQKRHVVVTLRFGEAGTSGDLDSLAQSVFKWPIEKITGNTNVAGQRRELHGYDIPLMLEFSNRNDPSTARIVRPNEFGKHFGTGYSFKGAWIELTQDDVSFGTIVQYLPWLKNADSLHELGLYKLYSPSLSFGSGLFILTR